MHPKENSREPSRGSAGESRKRPWGALGPAETRNSRTARGREDEILCTLDAFDGLDYRDCRRGKWRAMRAKILHLLASDRPFASLEIELRPAHLRRPLSAVVS
jgi:hypothetical protein